MDDPVPFNAECSNNELTVSRANFSSGSERHHLLQPFSILLFDPASLYFFLFVSLSASSSSLMQSFYYAPTHRGGWARGDPPRKATA